jgi:hypothetical protein
MLPTLNCVRAFCNANWEEGGGGGRGGGEGFSLDAFMWVFFSHSFPHKILHNPNESHMLATIHRSNDLCKVKASP